MSEISDYFLKKAEELRSEVDIEITKKEKNIEVNCLLDGTTYSKWILKDKNGKHQIAVFDYDNDVGLVVCEGKPRLDMLAVVRNGVLDKAYAPWYDEEEIDKGDSYKKAIDFMQRQIIVHKNVLKIEISETWERSRELDEQIIQDWHQRN